MASTEQISARYSQKLDSMARCIREFLLGKQTQEVTERAYKGIEIFCHNNSPEFTEEFLKNAGLSKLGRSLPSAANPEEIKGFVTALLAKDRHCLFLLKDTHAGMRLYQGKGGKGYGLLINRSFLCRNENEEDYFSLIQPIYDCLAISASLGEFLEHYKAAFAKLISSDAHFYEKSKQVHAYVLAHSGLQPITWVDMGFQFTFVLFCLASVDFHSSEKVSQDFYCLTAYPWLQEFFKGNYHSPHCENALDYELEGIGSFKAALKDRSAGSLAGFAIGDALGFPVAGIDAQDVPNFIQPPITGFLSNPKHPYFSHLQAGNYTDNTVMLMISAESISQHTGLAIQEYSQELAQWGKSILSGKKHERWAGPTALTAIRQLIQGKSYAESGSATTESCSSTYRVVPLGAYHYALGKLPVSQLKEQAALSGGITHNSELSRTGAALVALIISDLMTGTPPEVAVTASIESVGRTPGNERLVTGVLEAVEWARVASDTDARNHFGTGSPIYQTLPLAVFYFLKYQADFKMALLAAANSFRNDTPEETERLKGLSWEEQLIVARGGNADGIAGLTGAFMGAFLGLASIPTELRVVEDFDKLKELGIALTQ